jgi:hypothetical protein
VTRSREGVALCAFRAFSSARFPDSPLEPHFASRTDDPIYRSWARQYLTDIQGWSSSVRRRPRAARRRSAGRSGFPRTYGKSVTVPSECQQDTVTRCVPRQRCRAPQRWFPAAFCHSPLPREGNRSRTPDPAVTSWMSAVLPFKPEADVRLFPVTALWRQGGIRAYCPRPPFSTVGGSSAVNRTASRGG